MPSDPRKTLASIAGRAAARAIFDAQRTGQLPPGKIKPTKEMYAEALRYVMELARQPERDRRDGNVHKQGVGGSARVLNKSSRNSRAVVDVPYDDSVSTADQ